LPISKSDEISDSVPWATEYVPGVTPSAISILTVVPAGDYTLQGDVNGYANASVIWNDANTSIETIAATYHEFSDDGMSFVSGYENVTIKPSSLTLRQYDWYSDIVSVGAFNGTKLTSADGFHLKIDALGSGFEANGTLKTTVDGVSCYQPCNGC
jgi:hypothetical protein